MTAFFRLPSTIVTLVSLLVLLVLALPARAADEARLEAFLEVTGFDVALESIRLSADSAPQMLGMEARVAAAGGELDLDSAPGQGTRLSGRFRALDHQVNDR